MMFIAMNTNMMFIAIKTNLMFMAIRIWCVLQSCVWSFSTERSLSISQLRKTGSCWRLIEFSQLRDLLVGNKFNWISQLRLAWQRGLRFKSTAGSFISTAQPFFFWLSFLVAGEFYNYGLKLAAVWKKLTAIGRGCQQSEKKRSSSQQLGTSFQQLTKSCALAMKHRSTNRTQFMRRAHMSYYVPTYVNVCICVCMCVYVYTSVYVSLSLYIYIYVYISFLKSMSIAISIHVYICIYPCLYIYISTHVHVYISIYLYICASIYLSNYLSMHACMHACMYISI